MPTQRVAKIVEATGLVDLDRVRAYLPDDYGVFRYAADNETGYETFIIGEDYAGWTLDGYVLPRLASGLIFANEVYDFDTNREVVTN